METSGTLSVGSALVEGLQVTVIGLAIVFGVLVILMLVLMAFKAIFYKEPGKAKQAQESVTPVKTEAKVKPVSESEIDEEELVAVLTAAVAASLNTSTYNLRIRSYRRVGNSSPAWNKAGLSDAVNHIG